MATAGQLTRKAVEEMDEATLRRDVLIPLFRAMEFNGVHEYHGSSERGKDIIMWSGDKLGQRTNYAVVVVAERISGTARGKGSAAKVFFQVREAFGSAYKDLMTLTEQWVHHCWIVTSKTVKADARESIAAALGPDLRSVRLIDGDELWQLVEKYLRPQFLAGKIREVHDILRRASGNYRVVAVTGNAEPSFMIARAPRAEENADSGERLPIFNFPRTSEGREAEEALNEHLRTGVPVAIPAKFVGDLEIAQLLHSLVGTEVSERYAVVLAPRSAGHTVHCNLVIECTDGSQSTIPSLTFVVANAGTDQARLIGTRNGLPLQVEVTLRHDKFDFRISHELHGANAKQQLEAISFSEALHKGGLIRLIDDETDLPVLGGEIPPGAWPAPPPLIVHVLEELLHIQRLTGKRFSLPTSISAQDAQRVLELSQILRTGALQFSGIQLEVPLGRVATERMLNDLSKPDQSFCLLGQKEQTAELFGQTIELGRCETILPQAFVPKASRARLRRELSNSTQDTFTVSVRAPKEAVGSIRYERWLDTPEREKYPGIEAVRRKLDRGSSA